MTTFALQTMVAVCGATALFAAYRWMAVFAPRMARLYAVGLLARTAVGLGFAVSAFMAGSDLTTADARWFPDAQMYFEQAVTAADSSLSSIDDAGASPAYVRALALWMRASGTAHGGPLLFNLLVFASMCISIAALSRSAFAHSQAVGAATLVVGCVALSPNLIMLGSQPLKDSLFFGALVWVVVALYAIVTDAGTTGLRLRTAPVTAVLLGIYLISGMRAYYGLLVLGLLAGALGLQLAKAWVAPARRPWRQAGQAAVLLLVVWSGCRIGGGPYYSALVDPVLAPVTTRLAPFEAAVAELFGSRDQQAALPPTGRPGPGILETLERSRRGFENTGGATNMAPPELDRSRRSGIGSRIRGAALGLAAVFAPISLLRATGLVTFPGGGRMLVLTDVDTLFTDVTLCACLLLAWRGRHELAGRPTLAAFLLVLGCVSALLVGYVVTNYGTLFRLRLLAVVPLWLLPLVVMRPQHSPPKPS